MKNDKWIETNHALIKEKLKNVVKKAQKKNVRFVIPMLEERIKIRNIIFDYIRKNNRVIYGGTAINMWIQKKNPEDAIYDPEIPGDIEFYSPSPLEDMYNLCNILYKKKYKNILGREAMHSETYSIFVEHTPFCDISYMTESILKKNIPTKKVKGLKYADPLFLINDMFRVFSNPLHDYPFRLEKVFSRYSLIKKYYFNPPKKPENCECSCALETKKDFKDLIFKKYIYGNKDVILSGFYAYLYYMEYSNIKKKFYNPGDIFEIVIIVEDIKKETEKILKILNKYDEDLKIKEFTKFFQFNDRMLIIYYQDKPLINIIGYNKICTPFHVIQLDNKKDKLQIVGFDYLIQYLNARFFKEENCNHYYCMFYYLLIAQDYYLKKNKLTGIEEDHLFSHFMIDCKWITLSGIYIKNEQRKQRFKERKGPVVYEYRPESKYIKDPPHKKYLNASGNQILQKSRLLIKDRKYLPNNIK
jgi:hypothetical protein